ncbi:MAG TPA: DUF2277 domain-containing protein [Gaiellales bacterium]|nr:DUF2277 domain-containing protein [Gaiellales bacterium]
MCRNIRPLHNYDPPTTEHEVHEAALQYVRKVSGMTKPSRANEEAFARAVDAVATATSSLLAELVTAAPPRDRALEIARARERAARRFATEAAG